MFTSLSLNVEDLYKLHRQAIDAFKLAASPLLPLLFRFSCHCITNKWQPSYTSCRPSHRVQLGMSMLRLVLTRRRRVQRPSLLQGRMLLSTSIMRRSRTVLYCSTNKLACNHTGNGKTSLGALHRYWAHFGRFCSIQKSPQGALRFRNCQLGYTDIQTWSILIDQNLGTCR